MNGAQSALPDGEEMARSLNVPLASVMSRNVVSVRDDMSLDTLRDIMVERTMTAVPVLDEQGRVSGVVEAVDVMRSMHERYDYSELPNTLENDWDQELAQGYQLERATLTASDVMRPATLQLPESYPLMQAVALMANHSAHRVLVMTKSGDVAGLVGAMDVLEVLVNGSRESGVLPVSRSVDDDWRLDREPFVACRLGPEGEIADANLGLATALSCPIEGLMGRPFQSLVHQEDQPLLTSTARFVVRMARRDGSYATIDWRPRSANVGEQAWVGYDLSELVSTRRRLDAEVRIQRAIASAATIEVAAPQVLYWLARAEEWTSASFWWLNPRGEPVRAAEWPLSMEDPTIPNDEVLAARVIASGEPQWSFEGDRRPRRGACALPLRCDGAVVGVIEVAGAMGPLDEELVALIDGVSCRLVALERKPRLSMPTVVEGSGSATRRLATVGSLAGGISHFINNALTYVRLGLGRVISFDLSRAPHTPSRLHRLEMLHEVREGFEKIAAIARHLSAFSHVGRDAEEAVDVSQVLDSTTRLLDHELLHRARVVCDYGQLPKVLGNPSALRQAFLDIIVHVARSIDAGHASEHEIRVRASRTEDSVVVAVRTSDARVGVLASIEGDLVVAREVLTSFGGDLSVVSEGYGQSVRASLRIAPEAKMPPPESRPQLVRTAYATGRRILVVDDERLVAQAISVVLSEHDVVLAGNGREALEVLQRDQRFDVVFCDLMMPEMTGMDLHEAVELLQPALARRFVFMTGGAYTARARDFIERIDNVCLLKPFDSGSLHEAIERTLGAAAEHD